MGLLSTREGDGWLTWGLEGLETQPPQQRTSVGERGWGSAWPRVASLPRCKHRVSQVTDGPIPASPGSNRLWRVPGAGLLGQSRDRGSRSHSQLWAERASAFLFSFPWTDQGAESPRPWSTCPMSWAE